jgi:hypothetical protein
MSTLDTDTRRIMDDAVSLRLLLLLGGLGIGVFSGMLGFLWNEIVDNRAAIDNVPGLIEQAIQRNSEFQVEQRIRLWDRLNKTQEALNGIDRNQARFEGRLEQMLKSMDRVIDQLNQLKSVP